MAHFVRMSLGARPDRLFVGLTLVVSILLLSCAQTSLPQETFDWKNDWTITEGFSIAIDTEGYHFPTAMAFIPTPGSGPKDPLYFVTELRGRVKVVTNDRTVYTFAENFFRLIPREELPSQLGSVGLVGICLSPKHGYVFVTFAYQDEAGTLRNGIIRFQAQPNEFSLEPSSSVAFEDVFSRYESAISHQIGPCQIDGNLLYVALGDGFQPFLAQQLDVPNGKILRMTLAGDPVPNNPFYQDSNRERAINYAWAYGFRNPFSLSVVDGRVFVADNGPAIDRFVEVHKGENYLWQGNDDIFVANSDFVFIPSIGPVQMDYHPRTVSVFPLQYREAFFVGLSAGLEERRQSVSRRSGIMTINYNLHQKKVLLPARYFIKYGGDGPQAVTAVAFGPDGLYFAAIYANKAGKTPVFKASYSPGSPFPFTLPQGVDAKSLLFEKGCLGCHTLSGRTALAGVTGPSLEPGALVARLNQRLNSREYIRALEQIGTLQTEPQRSYKKARMELMSAEGMDRVRVWLKYRILEPRFDRRYSTMPNLQLSEKEALAIADFFIKGYEGKTGLVSKIKTVATKLFPNPLRIRHAVAFLVAGFALGCFSFWIARWTILRLQKRQKARSVAHRS
jgi:glucose/arabinose dehydrogenase